MAKSFIVTNTQPRYIYIAGISLKPGTPTSIDPRLAEQVRNSVPYRAGWIQEGNVVMPTPQIIATSIEKLAVSSAIKLIKAETNLAVLSAWADSDKRPEVVSAIQERVKE